MGREENPMDPRSFRNPFWTTSACSRNKRDSSCSLRAVPSAAKGAFRYRGYPAPAGRELPAPSQQGQIEVTLDLPAEPVVLPIHAAQIQEALANLIDNAVRRRPGARSGPDLGSAPAQSGLGSFRAPSKSTSRTTAGECLRRKRRGLLSRRLRQSLGAWAWVSRSPGASSKATAGRSNSKPAPSWHANCYYFAMEGPIGRP